MAFKTDAFMGQQFESRTDSVAVPELKEWFDGEPVWIVRNLSANEIWKCKNAGLRRDNARAFVDAVAKGTPKEKTEEFKKVFGVDEETETEIVIRQEMLAMGSVDPVCDLTLAVKLGDVHGIVFQKLSDKILELSGQGQIEKKLKASTAMKKSEARSK